MYVHVVPKSESLHGVPTIIDLELTVKGHINYKVEIIFFFSFYSFFFFFLTHSNATRLHQRLNGRDVLHPCVRGSGQKRDVGRNYTQGYKIALGQMCQVSEKSAALLPDQKRRSYNVWSCHPACREGQRRAMSRESY